MHGIYHRDIKAANILVNIVQKNKKRFISIYLSDFGEAMLIENTMNTLVANKSKELAGTPTYLAPELRKKADL
jgi:serine/threonine protein kinase